MTPFAAIARGTTPPVQTREALRRLSENLELQAKWIAQTLHDEAGQLLTSAHIALAEAIRDLPPPARERLQEVKKHLDGIEEQLRRFAHELRPRILDDLGLVPALEFLAAGVEKRQGISIAVEATLKRRLPAAVETDPLPVGPGDIDQRQQTCPGEPRGNPADVRVRHARMSHRRRRNRFRRLRGAGPTGGARSGAAWESLAARSAGRDVPDQLHAGPRNASRNHHSPQHVEDAIPRPPGGRARVSPPWLRLGPFRSRSPGLRECYSGGSRRR